LKLKKRAQSARCQDRIIAGSAVKANKTSAVG